MIVWIWWNSFPLRLLLQYTLRTAIEREAVSSGSSNSHGENARFHRASVVVVAFVIFKENNAAATQR